MVVAALLSLAVCAYLLVCAGLARLVYKISYNKNRFVSFSMGVILADLVDLADEQNELLAVRAELARTKQVLIQTQANLDLLQKQAVLLLAKLNDFFDKQK